MNRPLHGPQNPTPVDHATDTYDTIDWLVKNVPETQRQGRHPRHLLRRLPAADGARQSAPGAEGVGADEPDGRRLDGRRLVPQRRVPPAEHAVHLRAGGDARQRREVVDEPLRRLRHVHAAPARPASSDAAAASSRSASGARSSSIRPTTRSGSDQAVDKILAAQPLKVPVMLVAQPVGPGGHLRRDRRLQGDQAEGHRQRQGVPRDGAVASRPGDRRRQHARRAEVRQRHRAVFPARHPAAVPRPVPEGRRAARRTSPPVTAFETGTNAWRRLPAWPAGCASGCTVQADAALSRAPA